VKFIFEFSSIIYYPWSMEKERDKYCNESIIPETKLSSEQTKQKQKNTIKWV
jgi:hypothetical protein